MAYIAGEPNVFYKLLGGHYHMRVFVHGACMGELVCRENEFDYVKLLMSGFNFHEDY